MAPRVLVVDDQDAFRALVRELLESAGYQVVGEAADSRAALVAERELRPDVVLLDVRLPGGSGLETSRLMTAVADAPTVVLTSTGDYRHAVGEAGAAAFLPKSELSAEALAAVLDRR